MELNCEGCAGCCLDWRPIAPGGGSDHERRDPREPLDDRYNLALVTSDEVRAFLAAGYGDALVPRLYRAGPGDDAVTVDGHDLAAANGRPVFVVGLRGGPKPVAPFDRDPVWLETCAFLNPQTLQCRIHGDELYPGTCADYPGHNLRLDEETECERVEATFGGDRLLEDTPPDGTTAPFGPASVGATVFAHPDPERLTGRVARIAAGEPTGADRAEFVAVAAASTPGGFEVAEARVEPERERVRETESWVSAALSEWKDRAGRPGTAAPDPGTLASLEEERGAPATPGWDAVE